MAVKRNLDGFEGCLLYRKTGNGYQLDVDGNKAQDRQAGWFVGFVRKDDQVIMFAYLIVNEDKQTSYVSVRAKPVLSKSVP